MPLAPTQVTDYVASTLPVFRKNVVKDISLSLQRYEWVNRYLKGAKSPTRGGQYLKEMFKVKNSGSARLTGMFGGRNVIIVPHLKEIQVPWAFVEANWGFDVREDDFQGDAATILRVTKLRQHGMYLDYIQFMEYAMWSKADGPSEDPQQIWGIPTWLVKGSTSPFSFGGGDPVGFSSGVGGLSTATYPNWANGTFQYSAVSNTDLFKKWAEAMSKCEWMLPYAIDGDPNAGAPDFVCYTTYPVVSAIHDFLTAANDNLKTDAGMFRGKIYFKSAPVVDSSALTNAESEVHDTQHPIYGVPWNKVKWFFLRGWDMRLTGPEKMPNQTHGRYVQLDSIGNFIWESRREGFVGHTTTFAQAA